MFKQSNGCLSTEIYIDAIFSYYVMVFLKMSNKRKNFEVFKYIILVYVGFVLGCLCCSKIVFAQSVAFRHYWTTTKTTTTITVTTTTTTGTVTIIITTITNAITSFN